MQVLRRLWFMPPAGGHVWNAATNAKRALITGGLAAPVPKHIGAASNNNWAAGADLLLHEVLLEAGSAGRPSGCRGGDGAAAAASEGRMAWGSAEVAACPTAGRLAALKPHHAGPAPCQRRPEGPVQAVTASVGEGAVPCAVPCMRA